jgi:ribosomal protein L37E
MPDLRSNDRYGKYICGRCKGEILYIIRKGLPKVCPECGYGHGNRDVNNVPAEVKLNLRNLNLSSSGSRGKLEQATITSR